MIQPYEYETFKGLGKDSSLTVGYKKIRFHLLHDLNHDVRQKYRLMDYGKLTDIPFESVYYGVVYLHCIQLLIFIYESNKREKWATDIGNAYLKANKLEKFYIISGNSFGDREGHILIVAK